MVSALLGPVSVRSVVVGSTSATLAGVIGLFLLSSGEKVGDVWVVFCSLYLDVLS